MARPKQTVRLSPEAVHDQRTALVRDMVEKESAAQDAKTIKLRALRLAKEAEESAAAALVVKAPRVRKAKKAAVD